jgi:hypothetical protein
MLSWIGGWSLDPRQGSPARAEREIRARRLNSENLLDFALIDIESRDRRRSGPFLAARHTDQVRERAGRASFCP